MTVLSMVYEPDEILKRVTKPVTSFDDTLKQLVDDMFDTMYANNGCGLAAPQVGISLAVTVIDMSAKKDPAQRMVLINPQLIDYRGEQHLEAGCCSVPGVYGKVKRYSWVKVRAQNLQGNYFDVVGEDMLSECLQHELDHLQGKLFIDYLSSVKKIS